MVTPGRLELPAYGLGNRRSILLSYGVRMGTFAIFRAATPVLPVVRCAMVDLSIDRESPALPLSDDVKFTSRHHHKSFMYTVPAKNFRRLASRSLRADYVCGYCASVGYLRKPTARPHCCPASTSWRGYFLAFCSTLLRRHRE